MKEQKVDSRLVRAYLKGRTDAQRELYDLMKEWEKEHDRPKKRRKKRSKS